MDLGILVLVTQTAWTFSIEAILIRSCCRAVLSSHQSERESVRGKDVRECEEGVWECVDQGEEGGKIRGRVRVVA